MSSHNTYPVLLGFLLPWTWGISSRLLQQSAAAAPYLGRGLSSHGRPSRPWTWSSSSRPSRAYAAAPRRWGSSSRPQPLTSSVTRWPLASVTRPRVRGGGRVRGASPAESPQRCSSSRGSVEVPRGGRGHCTDNAGSASGDPGSSPRPAAR